MGHNRLSFMKFEQFFDWSQTCATMLYGNRSVFYESAACYMETAAVLYENVFESMSRPVTVS